MAPLDPLDVYIKRSDWKWNGFDMLPISFGLFMAYLDVLMMASAKMVNTGALTYGVGLTFSTLVYSLQPYLFIKALEFEDMLVVNIIWNLASDTIITLLGLFYFGETIQGLRWVAMILSVISIALFSYSDATNT
jgi:multidrug transporter EmrE-like cation transporter